jgi:hypothetical protein
VVAYAIFDTPAIHGIPRIKESAQGRTRRRTRISALSRERLLDREPLRLSHMGRELSREGKVVKSGDAEQ